jgi:hypothetical protein
VSSYVEVWGSGGRELRALDSERLTVGTLESNDVVVDADGVSRVHAVFERFGDTPRRRCCARRRPRSALRSRSS